MGLSTMDRCALTKTDLGQLVRSTSLERIIDAARGEPALVEWSANFTRRYLDVSVVCPLRG